MVKEKNVEYDPSKKILIVGDKMYKIKRVKVKKIDGIEHEDKIIFEPVQTKEYEKKMNDIIKCIEKAITKKDILKEIVKNMSLTEIDRIHKIITTKRPKIKKQEGCLGVLIDGGKHNKVYIELFD